MGTKLDFSSAFNPQIDDQTERVNQIIEDMLRVCFLTYGKDWEQVYPMLSFRTTTVIKQVWECHHLKLSMGESAEHP
jgi:hypothetical protein